MRFFDFFKRKVKFWNCNDHFDIMMTYHDRGPVCSLRHLVSGNSSFRGMRWTSWTIFEHDRVCGFENRNSRWSLCSKFLTIFGSRTVRHSNSQFGMTCSALFAARTVCAVRNVFENFAIRLKLSQIGHLVFGIRWTLALWTVRWK